MLHVESYLNRGSSNDFFDVGENMSPTAKREIKLHEKKIKEIRRTIIGYQGQIRWHEEVIEGLKAHDNVKPALSVGDGMGAHYMSKGLARTPFSKIIASLTNSSMNWMRERTHEIAIYEELKIVLRDTNHIFMVRDWSGKIERTFDLDGKEIKS